MRVDLDQLGPRRTVINNISVGSRANFFVINYLMDEFVLKKYIKKNRKFVSRL